MTTPKIPVEVLICSHNREDLLKRTLEHLNNATPSSLLDVSILVVANACTDGTHHFLERYVAEGRGLPLRWTAQPIPGKSNALNLALPMLRGAVTAMVDDDHRVDPDYFTAIADGLTRFPEADFFCGRIIPDWDGTEPAWVHDAGEFRIYPLPVPRFDLGAEPLIVTREIAVPGGGNLVVKTSLFQDVGGFATDFGPVGHNLGGAEDIEWVIRAYRLGKRLQYLPSLCQFHWVEPERLRLRYLMKKAFERSASVVRLSPSATETHFFPKYLVRKLALYFIQALLSISQTRRRFYLVRLAATFGEMKGFLTTAKSTSSNR